MSQLQSTIRELATRARAAGRVLSCVSSDRKSAALRGMADSLCAAKDALLSANRLDIEGASREGLSNALIDRLTLTDARIEEMADSLRQIAGLPDPVGEVIKGWKRPNGLLIEKVRVPLGLVAIIYESRPNVTADCAGLCLKSGNAVILRGGSESINSNKAIYEVIRQSLRQHGLPEDAVALVQMTDRDAVDALLTLEGVIDVVIPRGGKGLISRVTEKSRIPVIKHYEGICHVYVDEHADLNMAQEICLNAKVQRPATCNAMESMLVHKDVAARFLPVIGKAFQDAGVEIRGCSLTTKVIKSALPATEEDYRTEFLGLKVAVKVVDSLEAAIAHIEAYGSHHSDAVVTDDYRTAREFTQRVDSACVFVNASTRFTDGHQFGLGAEIGISTDKLHARGPMGLEELTTYKYVVLGSGQVRQ
jgi:glutamate-5-semialdehyde dehydrogenase